jgi:hypothetical protein
MSTTSIVWRPDRPVPASPAEFAALDPEEQKILRAAATSSRRTRARLARTDPNAFNEFVLRDEKTGRRVLQAPMHMQWQSLISSYERLIIWSHVDGGKTNQIAIGRVLFELGLNPQLRVFIVSRTNDLARKIMLAIGEYIKNSKELHEVFPHLRPALDPSIPWNSEKITVERPARAKDASVQACGIDGGVHGARIDLLILDDVIDQKNTETHAPRERVWNFVRGTLMGRFSDGARMIVIGNAWHPEDLMHRLSREPRFSGFRFPVRDEQGNLTWPNHWPHQRIDKARQDMGPLEFGRALLCVARDNETARFKQEYIKKALAAGVGKRLCATACELFVDLARDGDLEDDDGNPITEQDVLAWDSARRLGGIESDMLGGVRLYTGVDLAVSRKESADLTALFTLAVLRNGRRRVVEVDSGRWAAPDILRKIVDAHGRFGSTFIIENVAAQDYLVQFARLQQSNVPVVPFTTNARKADPVLGVEGLAIEFDGGKWIIPCTTDGKATSPEVEAWLGELYHYDPSAHTGDRLMASWFAREGHRPAERFASGTGSVKVTVLGV